MGIKGPHKSQIGSSRRMYQRKTKRCHVKDEKALHKNDGSLCSTKYKHKMMELSKLLFLLGSIPFSASQKTYNCPGANSDPLVLDGEFA